MVICLEQGADSHMAQLMPLPLTVTCGLTACTPGSAPGPTLGNECGKTLPFTFVYVTVWSVRLSVCLSVSESTHGSKLAGLLLCARRAGDIDRLLQQRRANAGSATFSAYVGS